MKILLTGANGFIGSYIKKALASNHELVTPSHQTLDFNSNITPEDWIPHLNGVDAVINAVGIIVEEKKQRFSRLHRDTPSALFKACEQLKINRVIQISALGADENAFTPYQKSKYQADNVLRNLDVLSFILRPSLVYGEGGKSFEMFKRLAKMPLIPFPDGGKQKIQPVHISDLVLAVKKSLIANQSKTIDIVGPKAMTMADYIQQIRAALGKPPAKIISIPMPLIMLSAHLGHYLVPIIHPDNMRMLQQGNTSDASDLIAFIGQSPRSLKEVLEASS